MQGTKILIGGDFPTVAGTGPLRLARLNQDGSVDPAFVCCLRRGGGPLANGTSRPCLARHTNTGNLDYVCAGHVDVAERTRAATERSGHGAPVVACGGVDTRTRAEQPVSEFLCRRLANKDLDLFSLETVESSPRCGCVGLSLERRNRPVTFGRAETQMASCERSGSIQIVRARSGVAAIPLFTGKNH